MLVVSTEPCAETLLIDVKLADFVRAAVFRVSYEMDIGVPGSRSTRYAGHPKETAQR